MPTEPTTADAPVTAPAPAVLVADDVEAVTVATADLLLDVLGRALVDRGEAVLALSGGRTPVPLYRHLATRELDWRRVHVVQVDERLASDGHPDRNWTAIRDGLVEPTGAVGHPMPVTADGEAAAADRYAAELAALGPIDACHLGLGDDGHTASLVPGDAVLTVVDRDVALTAPYQGRRRMTLTAPAINRAHRIVWQVVGGDKADALARLLAGTDEPAGLIRRDPDVWLVADSAAGAAIPAEASAGGAITGGAAS